MVQQQSPLKCQRCGSEDLSADKQVSPPGAVHSYHVVGCNNCTYQHVLEGKAYTPGQLTLTEAQDNALEDALRSARASS